MGAQQGLGGAACELLTVFLKLECQVRSPKVKPFNTSKQRRVNVQSNAIGQSESRLRPGRANMKPENRAKALHHC